MLQATVLSPQEVLFSGRAQRVILPGEEGVFEVCPFHKPIISRLLSGFIIVDAQTFSIQRGVVHVAQDVLTAIVEPELASTP